jgi:hypothetical protein
MAWRLRAGVSLHPMPFGGAFVLDDVGLTARQISSELTQLLAGAGAAPAGPPPTDPPPVLAAELRLGLDAGWLLYQDERHDDKSQGEDREEKSA